MRQDVADSLMLSTKAGSGSRRLKDWWGEKPRPRQDLWHDERRNRGIALRPCRNRSLELCDLEVCGNQPGHKPTLRARTYFRSPFDANPTLSKGSLIGFKRLPVALPGGIEPAMTGRLERRSGDGLHHRIDAGCLLGLYHLHGLHCLSLPRLFPNGSTLLISQPSISELNRSLLAITLSGELS